MGDFTFNVAKGRVVEFLLRVNAHVAPFATCEFQHVLLKESGLEADSVLIDKDTLADVLSGTTDEMTGTNYSRKRYGNTSGMTVDRYDDTDLVLPNPWATQQWNNLGAGSSFSKLLVCFQPAFGGPDSAIIPITAHDVLDEDGLALVPNGTLDFRLHFYWWQAWIDNGTPEAIAYRPSGPPWDATAH